MVEITSVKRHFEAFNNELKNRDIVAEVCICRERVFLIGFYPERDTADLSEIFKPIELVHEAWAVIEEKFGLKDVGIQEHIRVLDLSREEYFSRSHLKIFTPPPLYLLAMRCSLPFPDATVLEDIRFLTKFLNILSVEEVVKGISGYYPRSEIPSRVRLTIDECVLA